MCSALVVPMLVIVGLLLTHYVESEHTLLQERARTKAHDLAVAVDRLLRSQLTMAQMMAASREMESGDLAAFYRKSELVQRTEGTNVVVIDGTGQQVVNTEVPWGQPLGPSCNWDQDRRIFETGQPVISDLFIGKTLDHPVVTVGVPVRAGTAVAYVLKIVLDSRFLQKSLLDQELPSDWVSSITDAKGVYVARSSRQEDFVGKPSPHGLAAGMTDQPALWHGVDIEGRPIVFFVHLHQPSGWQIGIGVPQSVLEAPLVQVLSVMAVLSAILLALSAGLAYLFGHRMVAALSDLVTVASRRSPQPQAQLATPVREVNQVGIALADAWQGLARSEHDLRAALAQTEKILESISDAFYALDADWRFTYANRRALTLWGKTAEEILGQPLLTVFPQAASSETFAAHQRAIRDGDAQHIETISPVLGRWMSVHIYPTAAGGVATYFRDVSHRKRAEVLLKTRLQLTELATQGDIKELMQATVDAAETITGSAVGFFSFIDTDGKSLDLQVFSTRTMSTTEEKGLLAHGANLKPHNSLDTAGVWADCAAKRAPVLHNDYAALPHRKGLPAGHLSLVRELTVPVLREGKLEAILAVGNKIADYTEGDATAVQELATLVADQIKRKQAETQLRESEERLRAIIDNADGVIFIKDLEGRFLKINRYGQSLLGRPETDILGRTVFDLLPAEMAEQQHRSDREVIAAGRPREYEETATLADGPHTLLAVKFPMRDAGGRIYGVGCIATDITERKQSEERKALLMREVDHRAKNMLAVVQAVVVLTKADRLEDYRAAVEGRIDALSRVHTLLAGSRWQGARLRRVIEDEVAPYAGESRDRILLAGPDLVLEPAAAQAVALCLHELATNAAKYGAWAKVDGVVTVSWRLEAGDRIALDWQEQDGPLVEPMRASGFGTRLIRETIERQFAGQVRFDWRPTGLCCAIRMPLRPKAAAARPVRSRPDGTAAASADRGLPSETAAPAPVIVLVVEDDALISLRLREMMVGFGYQVLGPAANLDEARRLVADVRPAAALLDVNLNGVTSVPFAIDLAARGIPIVFCTGYETIEGLPDPLRSAPLLAKPVAQEALQAVLSQVLK